MKQYFFFVIVTLFNCQSLIAQKNTKPTDTTHHVTVMYDFLSKSDPLKILRLGKNDSLKGEYKNLVKNKITWIDVRKIYYGDKVNFRIRVNPFLYDVHVDGVNVFDHSILDTAYQNKLLTFFNSGLSKKNDSAPDVHNSAQVPVATENPLSKPSLEKQAKDIRASKQKDEATNAEIQKAQETAKKRTKQAIVNSLKIPFDRVKSNIVMDLATAHYKQKVAELYSKEDTIDGLIEKYEDEKIILENVLILSFADYKEYDSIIADVNRYLAYRIPGDTSNHKDTTAMNLTKLSISTDFVQMFYLREILHDMADLDKIYSELKSNDSLFNITTFFVDSLSYINHKNKINQLSPENLNEFSRAYSVFLQNLNNRELFEKSYTPKFAAADSFRLKISLSPSSRAKNLISLYKIPLRDTAMEPFTIAVKRYLKLNLSTGLSFLFGGAVPHTYFFSTPKDQLMKDSDILFIRKGHRTAVIIPKIALFTHLYLTNGNWGMPALTFGVSTNPADPSETAYMLGASLVMGNHKRMVATLGTALANIDQLKARYKVDEPQMKKYYQNIEEAGLVEKRLAVGLFFGLSYNF